MKIYQVLYFGLDNGGDKNGQIVEIGYCDDKQKAFEMVSKDSFEEKRYFKRNM